MVRGLSVGEETEPAVIAPSTVREAPSTFFPSPSRSSGTTVNEKGRELTTERDTSAALTISEMFASENSTSSVILKEDPPARAAGALIETEQVDT